MLESAELPLLIPRPSVELWPGIRTLPKDCERYVAEPGGSVFVRIFPADRIVINDVEGGQVCELTVIDAKGRFEPSIVGANTDGPASTLIANLQRQDLKTSRLKGQLDKLKCDLGKSSAAKLFANDHRAGESVQFTARDAGSLLIAVDDEAMDFDRQNTATPIEIFIHRADPKTSQMAELPDPLGEPVQDFRIPTATAKSFYVKAGEYIQIIDVEGRQCSDFQAFDRRKLDAGNEFALDATVTRSLIGRTSPIPGLPAKVFDLEMDPLVEMVQDTCGRHDVFMTACNSRYYDDMGYPGHVNCTDNFNKVLSDKGVQNRRGWEALNYFYNTNIDDADQIYFDEPWSRPGDYVLMRALTDLLCVASACPCDIDAANGWNPTDIHVRVYGANETFKPATAFRMTPQADAVLTKETGFHSSFAKHTRDFTEYNGYWLPNRFHNDGPTEEYWAAREAAVVMDLSPLRKFEVTGPDAEALLNYCVTRNISKLADGHVVYTAMCYEHGGMVDDGTVFRLAPENFRWIGGSDVSGIWMRQQAEKLGLKAWVRSSTDQQHNIAVQGPKSRDILKEIIWTPPARPAADEIDWFRFTVGRIGDFKGVPVVVSRTGYSGELGYEIFCHPRDCEAVFDAVWKAGQPHGLKPLGLEALDWLRIESGLIFKDYEFDDTTDPFEAGVGFTVALKTKNEDFMGKAALLDRKAHPRRKLVGLELDSQTLASNGDCIHIGRAQIGEITSGMKSPKLGKNIALARIDVAHCEVGTKVEIGKLDGHLKRIPATIVPFPHYDPKKERPRS